MAKKRKGFWDLLGSAETLVPIMLGVGAGLVFWGVVPRGERLGAFLAIAGCVGGLLTLLVLSLIQPGMNPAVLRKRREMADRLESLAALGGAQGQESPRVATAALVERG